MAELVLGKKGGVWFPSRVTNHTGLPRTPGFSPESSAFWETSQANAVGTVHHPVPRPWAEAGREMKRVQGEAAPPRAPRTVR